MTVGTPTSMETTEIVVPPLSDLEILKLVLEHVCEETVVSYLPPETRFEDVDVNSNTTPVESNKKDPEETVVEIANVNVVNTTVESDKMKKPEEIVDIVHVNEVNVLESSFTETVKPKSQGAVRVVIKRTTIKKNVVKPKLAKTVQSKSSVKPKKSDNSFVVAKPKSADTKVERNFEKTVPNSRDNVVLLKSENTLAGPSSSLSGNKIKCSSCSCPVPSVPDTSHKDRVNQQEKEKEHMRMEYEKFQMSLALSRAHEKDDEDDDWGYPTDPNKVVELKNPEEEGMKDWWKAYSRESSPVNYGFGLKSNLLEAFRLDKKDQNLYHQNKEEVDKNPEKWVTRFRRGRRRIPDAAILRELRIIKERLAKGKQYRLYCIAPDSNSDDGF